MAVYHSTGINRVEFSFNGRAAQEVNNEILNAETGEYEFVFNINTTDYTDGEYSITATVYPNNGIARELPLLNVYIVNNTPGNNWYVDADNDNDANTGTSSGEAFETIEEALINAVGGDNIYLATGNYELPGNWNTAFDRYVILQPLPYAEPKITADGMAVRNSYALQDTFLSNRNNVY